MELASQYLVSPSVLLMGATVAYLGSRWLLGGPEPEGLLNQVKGVCRPFTFVDLASTRPSEF